MTNENMDHLTPEEALDAFLDGELDLDQEQPLFDELQASPDLRGDMKDALSIRAAVHQDLIAPPADSEAGLLAAVGLAGGAAATGAAAGAGAGAGAGAAAAGSTGFLTKLFPFLYAGGGAVLGFLLAFFLLDSGQGAQDSLATNAGGGSGTEAVAGRAQEAPQPQTPVATMAPDTVYTVRYITRAVPVLEEEREIVPIQTNDADMATNTEQTNEVTTSVDAYAYDGPNGILTVDADPRQQVMNSRASASVTTMRSADRQSPRTSILPVTFRIRTLASGLPSDEPTPQSVQDAVFPNSAFALLFPVAEGHRVGLEMGTESFRQEFNGVETYVEPLTGQTRQRDVVYTQTPVLFWMGATYEWIPTEFGFLPGLAPFVNATGGYAMQQGPVGRGTVGLTYQPIGPLRFNLGLDGSWLMYQNDNAWYSSTKWGPSFGLSIDLGAIR